MSLALRPRQRRPPPSPTNFTDDEEDDETLLPSPRRPRTAARKAKRPRESKGAGELRGGAAADGEVEEGDCPSDDSLERPSKRPLVSGRTWLPTEDAVLIEAVATFGAQWKQIAATMQQRLGTKRTTAMCRNRHQRIRAPMQPGKEGRNRCKRCGQIKRGHTCTNPEEGVAAMPQPGDELGLGATHTLPSPVAPPAIGKATVRPSRHRGQFCQPTAGGVPADQTVLPETPILTPASGNAFNVDMMEFLAYAPLAAPLEPPPPAGAPATVPDLAEEQHEAIGLSVTVPDGVSADGVRASGMSAASLAARVPGFVPLALGHSLTSSAPPPIGARLAAVSQRSFGSISLSMLSDVDLSDLVEVDLSELQHCADAVLTSKSFCEGGSPLPPLRISRAAGQAATPTTLAGEGDEAAPSVVAIDSPQADHPRTSLVTTPLPLTPPESIARHLRAPTNTAAPFHAASSFDLVLADTSLTPPRPASPIKHVPIEIPFESATNGMAAPPPLGPLLSFSRTPSFAFAEFPVDRASILPTVPRFAATA